MRRLFRLIIPILLGIGHAPALLAAACTSAATGNWSAAGTWNAPCNVAGGPTAADTVTIGATHTVTLTANAAASTLTIAAATANKSLTLGGNTLAVTGAVTLAAPGANNITSTIDVGTGTLTAASIAINGGNNGRIGIVTVSSGTITTTGSITFGGTAANARFTSTGASTVNVGGNFGSGGTLTTGGTGTINFNGGAAQTIGAYTTYNNIRINNTAGGVTLTGTTTFGGTLQVQTGTFTVGAFTLQVNGATTIDSTLNVTSTTGTKTFSGDFTINSGGAFSTTVNEAITWGGNVVINNGGSLSEFNGNAAMAIAGSFQNDGTYTAGTGVHTFSGAGQTISGTSAISIASVTISGTYTNQNTLTISTTFAGAGTLTNGDATHASAVLNVGDTAIAGTIVLDASATGNTVNYNLNGAQTVKAPAGGNYFNLSLSTGGNKTIPTGTLNIRGDLSIGAGATYLGSTNNPTLNLAGNFTNGGTFTSGTGIFTFNGTAQQTLTGASTFTSMTVGNTGPGLLLASNITVTTAAAGTLVLTDGIVATGANILIVPRSCATPSVTRTNGWVNGNLRKAIPAGASTCIFQIGDASLYAQASLTFAAGTGAGNFTVSTTGNDHPNIATSTLDPNFTVNRYWTFTNNSVTLTTYATVFTFNNPADLDPDTNTANVIVQRFAGGAWNNTTIGTRTATTTQVTGLSAVGDFQIAEGQPAAGSASFNVVEPAGAVLSNIRTKVAANTVTLDLVALNAARNAINSGFKGPVTVELLNSSNNAGGFDANGCKAGWSAIQSFTTTFAASDSGRHQVSFTENNIYPDARIRVKYSIGGTDLLIGCSVDNFAIRPSTFDNVSVTDLDWENPYVGVGSPRALTNTGTSSGVVHKAGRSFTVSARALNAASTVMTSYAGSPVAVTTVVAPAGGANGSLSFGSWSASTGTVTSTTAAFSEAGVVTMRLEDQSYANVDASDGISSTADRYVVGPNFDIGRFVPDHFTFTSPNTPALQTFGSSCAGRSFTYVGQSFWYATLPSATIEARNVGNGVTTNYRGTLFKLTASGIGEAYSNNGVGPALNVGSAVSPPQLSTGNGTGTYTATASATNVNLAYARSTSTPIAPFTANISLTVTASDSAESAVTGNGTISAGASLAFNAIAFDAGAEFRYGRLRLLNATGPTTVDIPLALRAEYYQNASNGFVLNSADGCTLLAAGNFKLSAQSGSLTPANMGDTHVSVPANLTSGIASGMKLLKASPAVSAPGSVRICLDLDSGAGGDTSCQAGTPANLLHLQGPWSGTSYDKDPAGQANVGTFGAQPNNFIFFRENY